MTGVLKRIKLSQHQIVACAQYGRIWGKFVPHRRALWTMSKEKKQLGLIEVREQRERKKSNSLSEQCGIFPRVLKDVIFKTAEFLLVMCNLPLKLLVMLEGCDATSGVKLHRSFISMTAELIKL